jgi:hypothetical protein
VGTTVPEQPSKQRVDKHQTEMTDMPRSFHAGVIKNEVLNFCCARFEASTAMAVEVISCNLTLIHQCIYPEEGSSTFLRNFFESLKGLHAVTSEETNR